MVITDGKPVVLVLRYIRYLRCKRCFHGKLAHDFPRVLRLVSPDDREEIVPFQKLTGCIVSTAQSGLPISTHVKK